MNIELIKAILHVLDPAVDAPILSEAILPPSEDALQYLAGHAAKCFASDEAKACTLADDSAFLPLLWNIEDDFEKKTAVIRCVQLRKHSKAREKRYSFGYAVSFIFACYQILWTFPKSLYLCSRYLLLAYG